MSHDTSSASAATTKPYIGRFAPSPTGSLHMGSLLTAVASYLDAHSNKGQWLVRMEDLDPPREQPGAADNILRTLEAHQLNWHNEVMWQSRRHDAYDEALEQLHQQGDTFYCDCSRQRLKILHNIYDGRCRLRQLSPDGCAIRVRVNDHCWQFDDVVQGKQQQRLDREVGDFVVKRKDGLFAYQLAVVVDDIAQGITDVIRGSDLLDSTGRQLLLFDRLKHPAPRFAHLPVLVNQKRQKLSKQTHAPALDNQQASSNLAYCLTVLGLTPPADMLGESCAELLKWAQANWHLNNVPSQLDYRYDVRGER